MNDNLPELRDIHLPEGVSFFPPAYGWYVIVITVILCVVMVKLYKMWVQKSRKKYALKILAELDTDEIITSVARISELLRRICIYRYPQAVALSGEDWWNFIARHSQVKLSTSSKDLLLNAPYMNIKSQKYQTQNLQEITSFAQSWIGENL
ncbi:MAG: DUF4381 domain-containing protein [Alphaproteobacteria bacterium]|nr:DUF4381 domain-containing protein [Alphaproteobacteria bacterium]